MFNEFLTATESLYKEKEPFAWAFIINRTIPSSGKPGDKAIIKRDGTLIGWIGGGCTRGIVLKEAQAAINDGKPRLVKIAPDQTEEQKAGVQTYTMTCQSGGAVEVYIEPVLPRPHLVIMGKSHVAMALAKLGKAMDYQVSVVASHADKVSFPTADQIMDSQELPAEHIQPNSCIIVSTQGEGDEIALEQAIKSKPIYLAFVASMRKANAIFTELRQRGITFDQLKGIKTPAGLDIKAKLPEEVAVSILAEIIQLIRGEEIQIEVGEAQPPAQSAQLNEDLFINPVCGIPVQKSTAKHILEYQGKKVYFCCDGCKVSFEKEPEKYAMKLE
ncbi:MAG: XdhC family protein [Saprospiraceae bacterium]|nr:XdhC family protein [Saprospiraceae bacterium]